MITLKEAFGEIGGMLVRNIANDFLQLELHKKMSDEELMLFYGGKVNRYEMIVDTERKLDGDQRLLKFYQDNAKFIDDTYGNKNATDDFERTPRPDIVQTPGSGSDDESTEEGRGEDTGEDSEGDNGSDDNATEGSNDRGTSEEEPGSEGQPAGTLGGDQGDDQGRGEAEHSEGSVGTRQCGQCGSREILEGDTTAMPRCATCGSVNII